MNKLKTLWQKRQSYTLYWFVAILAVVVDVGLVIWFIHTNGILSGLVVMGGGVLSLTYVMAKGLARDYK